MEYPDVMTLREVAEYLRIHRTTLYRMIKRREFPALKVGSDFRFMRESIREWVESRGK